MLSDNDHLLVLEHAPSLNSSLMDSVGSQHGCGHRMFAQQCDKLHAFLHELEAIDDTLDMAVGTMATTKPQDGEGTDLIDSVCNTFDIDFETFYAHAAK